MNESESCTPFGEVRCSEGHEDIWGMITLNDMKALLSEIGICVKAWVLELEMVTRADLP